jgi:hypothetical protein
MRSERSAFPAVRPVPAPAVPVCPVDLLRMTETIVGWRCPICGRGEHRAA